LKEKAISKYNTDLDYVIVGIDISWEELKRRYAGRNFIKKIPPLYHTMIY